MAAAMATSATVARAADRIGLAIVYDTSGSMKQPVRNKSGRTESKDAIGRRALNALVTQLTAYVNNAPAGTTRQLETTVFGFAAEGGMQIVPHGKFDPHAAANWSQLIPKPNGATPLGRAVEAAAKTILNSMADHCHVLVITDGMNTVGPAPEVVLAPLLKAADGSPARLSVHFIAFDVAAKVFDPVKKLGATVLGAADEAQLNTQIAYILGEKILLEDETPTKK